MLNTTLKTVVKYGEITERMKESLQYEKNNVIPYIFSTISLSYEHSQIAKLDIFGKTERLTKFTIINFREHVKDLQL